MNIQNYFWGYIAQVFRLATKNKTKLIATGKIPNITTTMFGICIKNSFYRVSDQHKGIMGVAKITNLPQSNMSKNTSQMRSLWIGCELRGFLQSPNRFVVVDIAEISRALTNNKQCDVKEVHQFISFWKRMLCTDETLLFENCFEFKKEHFVFEQNRPFGSVLSGIIVNMRR